MDVGLGVTLMVGVVVTVGVSKIAVGTGRVGVVGVLASITSTVGVGVAVV